MLGAILGVLGAILGVLGTSLGVLGDDLGVLGRQSWGAILGMFRVGKIVAKTAATLPSQHRPSHLTCRYSDGVCRASFLTIYVSIHPS